MLKPWGVHQILTAAGNNAIQIFASVGNVLLFYLTQNVSKGDNLPDYEVRNAAVRKECDDAKTNLTVTEALNLLPYVMKQIQEHTYNNDIVHQYSLGVGEGDCLGDTADSSATSTTPSTIGSTSYGSGSTSGSSSGSSSTTTTSYSSPAYTPPEYSDKVCRTHWVSHENAGWLNTNTSLMLSLINKVMSCKSEYSDFLTALSSWLNHLNINGTTNFADNYDFVKLMDELRQDAIWIARNMELFKNNKDYLAYIASDILSPRSDQFIMTTENAYSDILQLIITPIQVHVCAI